MTKFFQTFNVITDAQIELAGRIRKIACLTAMPGMDEVAVKLNSGLTEYEILDARRWALAFELAARGGSVYALAHEYSGKLKSQAG